MSAISSVTLGKRLETAVRAICRVVESKVCAKDNRHWTEYDLRRELVACALGSQVRYEMATASLDRLDQAGLLSDAWWGCTDDSFESRVFHTLTGRNLKACGNWCYRFPKIRAHQLAKMRNALARQSLTERLSGRFDPKNMRLRLITEIPGLGPKQASMFLRNTGRSYELAILDVHVLRYMTVQPSLNLQCVNIATVKSYERTEHALANYADSLGYPVGYVDWAIWAVMRAAKELGL